MYTRNLVPHLPLLGADLDWVFYSPRPALSLSVDTTVLPLPRLWSQLRLPMELWRRRPELTFVPAHAVPFAAPGRTLTVVHDLAYERFPSAYGWAQREYLRVTTRWAEQRCSRLLAVSEATRRDLVELHGVDPDRVVAVHPGGGEPVRPRPRRSPAQAAGRLAQLGVRLPFALSVGRVEPRKNQVAGLGAVTRHEGLQLVLAGPIRDSSMAYRLAASDRSLLLGLVSNDDLALLYESASVLLYPSLYEGFGFPVLEAMRRGLPVVCGRVSSLPEVAGPAAEYADDPRDEAALAAALDRVLSNEGRRRELSALGRIRAAGFTWEACARGVLGVIRSLLDQPHVR
jgi:glycosyltransferase involved in cell wall biosynthesis